MNWCRILIAPLSLLIFGCGQQASDPSGVQPVYDENTAFVLVAQEIPAGGIDYYLFDFNQGLAVNDNVQEIQEGLLQNPLGSAYMAVIGPDPKHNLAVTTQLMQQHTGSSYPDLSFIYLGPAEYETRVRALLQPLQADVRYVVYP